MNLSGFFNPTRSSYDSNHHRLLEQQQALLHAMERLSWDEQTQGFNMDANIRSRRGVPRLGSGSSYAYSSYASVFSPAEAFGSAAPAPRAKMPRWR